MSDFITAAVIREAMASIVREMRRSMVRSSYSSIIYEGYDFSCVLIDGQGRLVAQSGEDHPFHIIPVGASVAGLLGRAERIGESDVFLHNDPYTGGTHLNDVAVIWPVFDQGGPLFFIVIRSHWADIGGMTPGSLSGEAREILHEGLRLNHIRVPKDGASDTMRLIFDNVRVSGEAVSDFHAVLGICRVAEKRLRELWRRYSIPTVSGAVDALLDASERRMRASVAALPSGEWSHRAYLDGSAATPFPLTVAVRLAVSGDRVHADFSGTSAQVAAPLNAGPAIAPTSVLTILKSFLDPGGVINDGTLRCIDVTAPAGTILHATPPAPCGGLNEVRFAADAAVMGALAQIVPEKLTGDVRGTSNHTYIGGTAPASGRSYIFYEYPSGGTGGSRSGDGNHAVRAFNEGENVSIQSAEVVEAIYPLRILQNELRPDSGGAGEHRGGCGLVRRVLVEGDDALLSVLSDRNLVPPGGVNAGASGAPNRYEVRRGGQRVEISGFPGKAASFPLRRGDVVVMQSSGGGGFGEPRRRAPEALQRDLDDGVVTREALPDYGFALDGSGKLRATPAPAIAFEIVRADFPATHQARMSRSLARRLGVRPGQLVELYAAEGPASRFWVTELSEDGRARCWVDHRVRFARPPDRIRALDSFAPHSDGAAAS